MRKFHDDCAYDADLGVSLRTKYQPAFHTSVRCRRCDTLHVLEGCDERLDNVCGSRIYI
jgi:hypothetical protein